jgi:hypothetical protein
MEPFANFMRGFVDASGLTLNAAREYWSIYAMLMTQAERETLEIRGYRAGQAEGSRWLTGHTHHRLPQPVRKPQSNVEGF